MRNSSLVEWSCAEDVTGLSLLPKLRIRKTDGRGAFYTGRSHTERSGGLYRRENAGMSSDKGSENLPRRKPKVS